MSSSQVLGIYTPGHCFTTSCHRASLPSPPPELLLLPLTPQEMTPESPVGKGVQKVWFAWSQTSSKQNGAQTEGIELRADRQNSFIACILSISSRFNFHTIVITKHIMLSLKMMQLALIQMKCFCPFHKVPSVISWQWVVLIALLIQFQSLTCIVRNL